MPSLSQLLPSHTLCFKMLKTTTIGNTRAEFWRARLASALRAALACTIVGCTALYGPPPLRRYLEFPAFSYVTTILVVSDATLGDTLRGCWLVFYATLQAMIISILSLQVVGPANFTNPVAALAVAVGAFVVALPESNHLMTKRIAFCQLVIVYVSTVIHGAEAGVVMHPIHVASSTALGALASVLAMLFPYPRLAYYEIKHACRLYAENASERLNHNLEAISASDYSAALDFLTKAKSLSTVGAKLLHCIKSNLDGMRWERPQIGVFNPNCIDSEEKLLDMEIPIRGMEIALSSCTSFPLGIIDEEFRNVLLDYKGQFTLKLDQQAKCFAPFHATTAPDSKKEILNCFSGSSKNLCIAYKNLPTSFFIYCVELLLKGSPIANNTEHMAEKTQKTDAVQCSSRRIREAVVNMLPRSQNLAFAFKCSLSLGLAVLFGLTYNKENGYWSGLTIAISFTTARQATFSVANARGQGTAMGSIYGILCCFMFERFVDLRLLPLLPWVIFSCFLMNSRMYGQAGGISAVIGALLILGRKYYGPPSQFAIARITEATIGLICFIIVEILMHPSRAATLAKSQLSQSLRALQDCIDSIAITPSENQMPSLHTQALRERQEKLKSFVSQLEKLSSEAESEPSFWFLPFHGACYSKMLESLSKMADLLLFVAYSTERVPRLSQKEGAIWCDLQDRVNENIELFKTKVGPTLKFLEEITRMKSLRNLEKVLKNKNLPCDIESGKYSDAGTFRILCGNGEVDSITGSFFQHLEGMVDIIHTNKDEEMLNGQMIFHYSCLGFCIISLMKETIKIENEVKELFIWENPSSHANLKEIYGKISAQPSQ